MQNVLSCNDAIAIATLPPYGAKPRIARRVRAWRVALGTVAVALGVFVATDRWLRATTFGTPVTVSASVSPLFVPPILQHVTVSAAGQRAPWVTTDQELRHGVEMWKRMHLADWNGVPTSLREEGLDHMLAAYRHILNNPQAWDRMDATDWDAVPQPVRTVAFRRMVAYWSGFYGIGAEYGLKPALVSETVAAIVMSESWFDHRARSVNRDGTWDVGLGQASTFARQRVRALHASGRLDASLHEDDYDNPWMATRFVAMWIQLMLAEADGDLSLAVRAYNRGIGDATDRLGTVYWDTVQSRLVQYIRNDHAPAAWDYVWRRSRGLLFAPGTSEDAT